MTSMDSEKSKNYIKTQEQSWLDIFSMYIPKEKTLKIGNGFGHLSELVRPLTKELSVLDIQTYPLTINKDAVQIYDGLIIPYPDKSFDTAIIVFTLHHIPESREYFQEIMRVTKKRIIVLEETYDNIFQKLYLYYRDWLVNKNAEQSCDLHYKSYFSRKELNGLIKSNNLIEIYRLTKKHKSYFKELVILDIYP
jgi:ubiquinone/menaquinone biosynthesis C-methylase UbiE